MAGQTEISDGFSRHPEGLGPKDPDSSPRHIGAQNDIFIYMTKVTIGLIQSRDHGSKGKNLENTAAMIKKAAKAGAKIICLIELFDAPYFPQVENAVRSRFAELVPGKVTRIFSALAKELGIAIIAPLCEKSAGGKYYNTAVVFGERGKILGKYRKIHIPNDPGFYEKKYFKEGDMGYKVFKTKYATFAVLICYDQWYPEAAREARLAGAEIIFYPTGLGNIVSYKPEGDWHGAWETMQRSHAIANSVHVAAVNRVGREGRMNFFGQSFVSDPFGKVLARAGKTKEQILIVKLDLERNKFFAEGWGFLRNRRPDTYKSLVTNKFVDKSKKLKKVPHYKDEISALKFPSPGVGRD